MLPYGFMQRVVLFGLALWVCGCGHPASVEECEAIVERIARLEIKERDRNIAKQELDAEVEETKTELRQKTLKRCVGKRITDEALRCVKSATTSQEIIDDCLD